MAATVIFEWEIVRQSLSQSATRWLAVEQYQSIDDTIVQLFISQGSVLMTRVDRIQSESS